MKMNEEFAALLSLVHHYLETNNVPPGDLHVYLTQLSVSTKENIPFFSDSMAEIMSQRTINQIFAFLSRIGAWSFLNYRLLECVAKRFGDEDLRGKVWEYGQQIQVFKSQTKLADFLRVWSGRSPYGTLPDRMPLIAKFEANWPEFTLADLAKLQGYIASEFNLEEYVLHFSNGESGCVHLMWLVPTSVVVLIKRAIMENNPNLKLMNISELTFDGFVYKV